MSTVPRLCVPFSFIEDACPAGATSCSPSLFFTYSRNCKSYQVCGLRLLTIRPSSSALLDLLPSTIPFIRSFHARTSCSQFYNYRAHKSLRHSHPREARYI
ncbi:hypothetical protein N431DRAFT_236676 [Stipitochalara longipes BDJ]|nr:hypothetical protein N431DRAFT_236676 [Stipitochalara longipes BDJ]